MILSREALTSITTPLDVGDLVETALAGLDLRDAMLALADEYDQRAWLTSSALRKVVDAIYRHAMCSEVYSPPAT